MERFTNGKPRIATDEERKAPWGGHTDGRNFRCGLCGHSFKVGDYWRWVYNPGSLGNFMVCEDCDGESVAKVLESNYAEYKAMKNGKYWKFMGL